MRESIICSSMLCDNFNIGYYLVIIRHTIFFKPKLQYYFDIEKNFHNLQHNPLITKNMKKIITILLAVTFTNFLFSQVGSIHVNAGKIIDDGFFKQRMFVFENFQPSIIKLSNGEVHEAMANISNISQGISIITQQGDTVNISAESLVQSLQSKGNLFVKQRKMYLHIINTNGDVSVGLNKSMKITGDAVKGPYGLTNDVASFSVKGSFEDLNNIVKINSSFYINYNYRETVFLLSKGKMLVANKKNIERLFPKERKEKKIESYIKENNIRFTNSADVLKLLDYLINNSKS